MIAIDLCKVNYQNLVINYLILTKKNVRNAREDVNLLDLKMIDYTTHAKNLKNMYVIKDGLIKHFSRIYKFCKGDLNKFFLLLRKDVYPYEYLDS